VRILGKKRQWAGTSRRYRNCILYCLLIVVGDEIMLSGTVVPLALYGTRYACKAPLIGVCADAERNKKKLICRRTQGLSNRLLAATIDEEKLRARRDVGHRNLYRHFDQEASFEPW